MIQVGNRSSRDRAPAGGEPVDINGLVQARIDGRLSRRGLLERAAALGIAVPVIGVILHATSDLAFGRAPGPVAPVAGRRLQVVAAQQPTAPDGAPQEGGTLTAAVVGEPATLHPWLVPAGSPGADVVSGVSECLLRYDSGQQLQPSLAESFELSPDGLAYSFHLRPGATWHNGDAFTIDDLIATWRMIVDPAFVELVDSPAENLVQLGWDKIVEIRAEGDNAVIVTSEPYAPFLSYVAGSTPLCPAAELAQGPRAFKEAFSRSPIGTGPLRFAGWAPGERIRLERFEDYWGESAHLDAVEVRFVPDEAGALEQMRTGSIQMISGASALSAGEVDEALSLDGVVVLEHPTLAWSHLDLKQIGFLRETEVRQALDFATPAQEIVDGLLGGRAIRAVADQAPGTPYHNPDVEPRPYDLEQAGALLDEVGLLVGEDGVRVRDGQPFEMELWGIEGDSHARDVCRLIAESWNQIGVKTENFFAEPESLWGPMGYQFTDKMTACLYAWINANDPDDTFYWHSSQIPTCPTCAGGNWPAFFYPYNFQDDIDFLTEQAIRTTDPQVRIDLYRQIQALLHEEVPVIFLYWQTAYPVLANTIGGHWPSAYNRLFWNVQEWYLTAQEGGLR